MRGLLSPRNSLRGQYGIDHRFARHQPERVRQRDTVAKHGADNRLALHHRRQKIRAHVPVLLQLITQLFEKLLLGHGPVHHAKMPGVEIFLQHPGPGSVHQHQLADLLQLKIGRKRRHHHHRLIFFRHPRGGNHKILGDGNALLVVAKRGDFTHL